MNSWLRIDEPLGGEVEVDETYIGERCGGLRGRPATGDPKKKAVLGMAQRKGRGAGDTVPNARRTTVMPHVRQRVLLRSVVYTDELKSYDKLKRSGYHHRRIHHAEKAT